VQYRHAKRGPLQQQGNHVVPVLIKNMWSEGKRHHEAKVSLTFNGLVGQYHGYYYSIQKKQILVCSYIAAY